MFIRRQGMHDGAGSSSYWQLTLREFADIFRSALPAVSQHLKVLLEANVVTMENQAKQRIYRLNPVAISEVEEWTRKYRLMWSRKFEKLDILLQDAKKKPTSLSR